MSEEVKNVATNLDDEFRASKQEIDEIVARAEAALASKLAPVREVVDEIRKLLAHGTDTIPTAVINQWTLELATTKSELSSFQEAYALASTLWDIDIRRAKAKNIVERGDKRKTDVESQNVVDSADKETQRVIFDYMHAVIDDTRDDIRQLLSELNRIIDARVRNDEAR